MKINHFILHILDFVACENTFAGQETDPSDKRAKNYALKHARKALNSIDNKRGSFAENSAFKPRLVDYFAGRDNFVTLSADIADFIGKELQHMEKPVSTDVMVVDFEDDTDDHVREMTEEEAEAAYKAQGKRYFAILLLESKSAYMHDANVGEDCLQNSVTYNQSVLPSPSQKVSSYCIIDAQSLEVRFNDKPRTIAGEETWLIPDKLLQCSMSASTKEVFTAVTELVEAVAEEYGENTAVSVSKAKRYAAQTAIGEEVPEIDLEELGNTVFPEHPEAAKRFEEAALARELPERVPMEKKAVTRVAKSHKIRTDTGIEITFPAEYGDNPDYMSFIAEADGTYSISLHNIGHIENR